MSTVPFQRRHGSNIGQPLTRREGQLKVTGTAMFAGDNHPHGMLHAVIVGSTVASGTLLSLDVDAAKKQRGVVEVMTVENRPPFAYDPAGPGSQAGSRTDALQTNVIKYANQPIAVIIAETLEAATEAGFHLAARYEVEAPLVTFSDSEKALQAADTVLIGPTRSLGDVEAGMASSAIRIEAVYDSPAQYHNPMEPHTIVAAWDGDSLVVDTGHQGPGDARADLAKIFGVGPEKIVVRSQFLGGGFGSKATLVGAQLLCVLAARMVHRPVKLALSRHQMFGPVGHRGKVRQTIRLGLNEAGHLLAVHHHTRTSTSVFDDFVETASNVSHSLYATPSILSEHECLRLNVGTPTWMRAPGEASGSAALEVAIDEAAFACNLDPLEFRLRNYADLEPISGRPFSSKALRECYSRGASIFGWERRVFEPRGTRDENGCLVGWGVGTATFPAYMSSGEARAVLRADGTCIVETSSADMGQGSFTALAQIAADSVGLPSDRLEFRTGNSDLPNSGGAGGSAHTAGAGAAIYSAGQDAISKLASLATNDERSILYGAGNEGVVAREGRLFHVDDAERSETYVQILDRAGVSQIEGFGRSGPDPKSRSEYAMHSHGAVFAEVRVDPELGQVRVSRVIGAFAVGRVINPRLVRSQLFGGMIWGLSYALHEGAVTDQRTGRITNSDFAGYHIPVNADVVSMDTILVHEEDPYVNPLGVKGVGEIGITGSVGAIANAVWHATGIRTRSYPIRLHDLI